DEYVVQLFSGQDPLVELTWDAKEAGAAISADDSAALRDAADVALNSGAVEIPEQLPGGYIDEKNRVTGFSDDGERFVTVAEVLRDRVDAALAAADGVSAPPPAMDAGQFWASIALGVLDKLERLGDRVDGIDDLTEALKVTPAGLGPDRVAVIRARAVALLALVSSASESVLAPSYELAGAVTGTGPTSDVSRAILLEAAGQAPADSLASDTKDFSRAPKDDIVEASDAPADPDAGPDPVVARFLFASEGLRLIYLADGERDIVEPDAWLAYRRGDGRLYWLPEGGSDPAIALTDGSLRGWLWSRERMAVVDAQHVGSVSALLGVR
ncbi:MAG: hypothetical protein U1E29_15475, partial [Coriobacteriia bacterium]|nr:hypothetical protein [Coriobacteriia bacterium]